MRPLRIISWCLLVTALLFGTVTDVPPQRSHLVLGGYQVLAADLHVHPFPLSAGTIAPWDLLLEARRQGLDVIAVTGHNEVLLGKTACWFSRHFGGPIAIGGEEVHTPGYHLVAAGIHTTISWRLSASAAIAETHRQGGIAIAAHPTAGSWASWGDAAKQLDGAEVLQPAAWSSEASAEQMRQFYGRAPLAAIGSSDYHGLGLLGVCRTYVFAVDRTEQAVLQAIRDRRTVVYDRSRAYGDPALIELAAGRLPLPPPEGGRLAAISWICGIFGMLGVICCGFRR